MEAKTENTIKRLEQDRNKTDNPELKKEITSKINTLKSGKTVTK